MVHNNIRKLYALIVAQDAIAIAPILVPFLEWHGLTLQQIFLLQGIYTLTWVAADVPTGYFADVWSRRQSLIAGSFCLCLCGLAFAFGHNFWHFCVAEFLLGLGRAFNCGTIQAMTYDTLLDIGDTGSYRRIASSQNIISYLSTAVAGILGGIAAGIDMRLAGAVMLPFFAAALILSLIIDEPKRHSLEHAGHLRGVARVFHQSLIASPSLRVVILAYGLVAAMTFSLVWFTQPYQAALTMPVGYFGIINAVFMGGMMAASRGAYLLEKRLDDRLLLALIMATVLACYFLLGLSVSAVGLLFLCVGRSAYGALDTLTSDMINRLTGSERRATVLSMRSFIYNLIFTLFSPLIGYAAGVFTLNEAILIMGIGAGVIMLPLALLMRKAWKDLPA